MALLTLEQQKRIPALYSQEEVSDPICYLFLRCGKAFWLITESNDEGLAFGYADLFGNGDCGELGYISLEEMEELASDYFISMKEIEMPLSQAKAMMYK